MRDKVKHRRSLEEVLQSVSDVLFPAELGNKKIAVNSKDVDGDTPLHVLTRRGDVYGAKLVLEAGADVNSVGDMGETALHVALSVQNERLTEMLLHAGADPDIRSEFNETAREKAYKLGGSFAMLLTDRKKPAKRECRRV